MKQKTFLMLKPDAFAGGHAQEVLRELRSHGLVIEKSCTLTVTMDVMKTLIDHYAGVIDSMSKDFNFPGKLFNSFYYDGPHTIMPMTLAGKTNPQDAGADTIRGKYSDDSYEKASAAVRLVNNVIHASDSHESAQRELNIWKSYLK